LCIVIIYFQQQGETTRVFFWNTQILYWLYQNLHVVYICWSYWII